mgnify:CR=1 FL=1
MNPADTWANVAGESEVSGAPQVGPDNLGDARRAAGEAGQQAKVLKEGAGQLAAGIGEAQGQTQQLIDALTAAQTGSQQLSDGMVQLQAGTGQLGAGATQLADSIGEIVGQVVGFEAVRGQVVSAIDRAMEELKDAKDPEAVQARESLKGLREQAETAQLPPDVVTMNATVRFTVGDGGPTLQRTLVYPRDADQDAGRLSVLAPVGSALLGLRVGQHMAWPTPAGPVQVRIDELVWQPERAGEFHR